MRFLLVGASLAGLFVWGGVLNRADTPPPTPHSFVAFARVVVTPRPRPTPTAFPCVWYRQAADNLTARSEDELGRGHTEIADKYARGADLAAAAYNACKKGH